VVKTAVVRIVKAVLSAQVRKAKKSKSHAKYAWKASGLQPLRPSAKKHVAVAGSAGHRFFMRRRPGLNPFF
jgi:hypothetical protein